MHVFFLVHRPQTAKSIGSQNRKRIPFFVIRDRLFWLSTKPGYSLFPNVTVSAAGVRYYDLIMNNWRSFLPGQLIFEDFFISQVEFEKRFNSEQTFIDCLANMIWPDGFRCRHCRY